MTDKQIKRTAAYLTALLWLVSTLMISFGLAYLLPIMDFWRWVSIVGLVRLALIRGRIA